MRSAPGWGFFGGAALVLVADQVTKWAADRMLAIRDEPIRVWGPVVRLARAHNTGAVFGLFPGTVGYLAIISLIVCLAIAAFATRALGQSRLLTASLALALGGAAGNLVDRVGLGYVRDFFEVGFWPAFNVADAAITVGVVLLIAHLLFAGGKASQPG